MDTKICSWKVYILRAATGALYTGITTDMERRFREHSSGQRGARYFRLSAPVEIVFIENHPDRASASRREAAIKGMSRKEKLALIAGGPEPDA